MHALDARADAQRRDFQDQGVTGHHWPAKTRFLDPGKEHEFAIPIFDFAQRQNRAALRQGFDHQHSRHDRSAGKMSLKERFVDADLFDADNFFTRLKFDYAIYQQKRITMRQELSDTFGVEDYFHELFRTESLDAALVPHFHSTSAGSKPARPMIITRSFRSRSRRFRCRRHRRRILTVVIRDERAGNVQSLSGVNQRHR